MVTTELTKDTLVLRMPGWDAVWSLRSTLTIPLKHIVRASVEPTRDMYRNSGFLLRMGGTSLPGVIVAGQYLGGGKWSFWNVHRAQTVAVLDLEGEHFSRVVVEVDDPDDFVVEIKNARSNELAAV